MVSSHSTSSCSTEQFHKILGWEDNFPDYKCYNSLFILQSQWYFSAIGWRKDSLFTVKMVLISITSDPNDFLCAPPGGSVCSKPVHNWSNGIRTGGSGNKATTGPPPRVTSTAAEQSRNEDRLPSCAKIRQPVMWWRSYIQTCKRYLTIFGSHYFSSLSIDDKQTFRESFCYYSFHTMLVTK